VLASDTGHNEERRRTLGLQDVEDGGHKAVEPAAFEIADITFGKTDVEETRALIGLHRYYEAKRKAEIKAVRHPRTNVGCCSTVEAERDNAQRAYDEAKKACKAALATIEEEE
jgi:hypothetical protein